MNCIFFQLRAAVKFFYKTLTNHGEKKRMVLFWKSKLCYNRF